MLPKVDTAAKYHLWLSTMSSLPSPSKLLEARLLIAKSTAKNKKTKAKKAQTTAIPPAHKTKSKDKENATMQVLTEKAKHVAIT